MDWEEIGRARTLSLPDRLSVDLERLILEGRLSPGEKIPPERELAEHFGVSRASVRDALRELESRRLIDRRPGRGTTVLSPADRTGIIDEVFSSLGSRESELHHILELRAIVEPPIARITATRATHRDLAQLRELVEAMEQDPPKARYAELDRAFHQAIAQYTHNPLLEFINQQISQQSEPARAGRYQTSKRRAASSAAHRRIYAAIAARDADLAEQEARRHVLDVGKEIMIAAQKKRSEA